MDIFSFLSYINKISLLAFFITTLVVGYQIYALRKDKTKEKPPSIPDFKDMGKMGIINYTSLPNSLTKKNNQLPNYSKWVFFSISLLTIIVVIFVLSLIRKSSTTKNEPPITPTIVVLKKPTLTSTPTITLSPSPSPSPIGSTLPTSTPILTPTVVPTEIILAQQPSVTDIPEATGIEIATLPKTGDLEKGLLIVGVAIATIVFSFVF